MSEPYGGTKSVDRLSTEKRREYCDGQVTVITRVGTHSGRWWERWKGPGGIMTYRQAGKDRRGDAQGTYETPEGETHDLGFIAEGGEYPFLHRVFGPELWDEYRSQLFVGPGVILGSYSEREMALSFGVTP